MWRNFLVTGAMLVLSQASARATVPAREDVFLVHSVNQVMSSAAGGLVFTAAKVVFRERVGVEFDLGAPSVQITGYNPNLHCLELGLASRGTARLVIRVKENEFNFKPGEIRDRITIAPGSIISCSSVGR